MLVLFVAAAASHVLIVGPEVETREAVGLVPGEGWVLVPDARTATVYENGPVAAVVALVSLVPPTSAGWRRLHASGRPGWLLLLPGAAFVASLGLSFVVSGLGIVVGLVFLVGAALMLAWLAHPSDPGPNRFGEATPG